MTCRRGVPIDRNGMPILVEKGDGSVGLPSKTDRGKHKDMLSKKVDSVNYNSSASIQSNFTPVGRESMRQLSQKPSNLNTRNNSIGMLTRNSSSNRRLVMSHSPLKLRGKDWINKVDDLIQKFDESFRENEIQ